MRVVQPIARVSGNLACDEKRLYGSDGRILLAGCHVSSREIKYSVSVGTAISVAAPDDGIYIEDVYPSWGSSSPESWSPHFLAPGYRGLRDAAGNGLEPKILHWEDRATEWSGKADRVKVSLRRLDGPRLFPESPLIVGEIRKSPRFPEQNVQVRGACS